MSQSGEHLKYAVTSSLGSDVDAVTSAGKLFTHERQRAKHGNSSALRRENDSTSEFKDRQTTTPQSNIPPTAQW